MRLAAIQYRPPKGAPERARVELQALIREAGRAGADLIVCPEMATTGYVWSSPAEIGPHTEPARGPTFQMLAASAREVKSWIVCGFAERFAWPAAQKAGAPTRWTLYNSALVVNPEGQLVTCYRKVLLYSADTTWANPGWRRSVTPTHFGTMSTGICMDINDDGFTDFLREVNPDVVAFCTNWVSEGLDVAAYWRERLQGWSGWFVAGNTWGEDRGTRFSGRSAILGPDGQTRAELGPEGDGLLLFDTLTG
jgi:predicted amidohydrolase